MLLVTVAAYLGLLAGTYLPRNRWLVILVRLGTAGALVLLLSELFAELLSK